MSPVVRIGLGAAAVVLLIGCQSSSSSSPGASPSAEPSTSADSGLPVGSDHVLWDTPGDVGITITIPSAGWFGDYGGGILTKNDSADPPDGAGMIVFQGPLYVYGDACQWSTTLPDTPATTVDELIAALAAQTPRDAEEPTDVTTGGYSGKVITLHVPDDAAYSDGEFTDCDQGSFGSWTVPNGQDPYRYHQGPGQIDEVYVLDVNGVLVAWDTAYYAGTPDADVDDLRGILESATFQLP